VTRSRPALGIAQCGLPAANVRPTAVDDSLGDKADCSVGIIVGRARDGLAGAPVTIEKARERGYRLVANVDARVIGQDVRELCDNVGDAEVLRAASLTRKTVQRKLAHGRHGIAQSKAECAPRGVAGVVVQKGQAGPPDAQIRVAERGDLQGGNGQPVAAACAPPPGKRAASTDEVAGDVKVRPRHDGVIAPAGIDGQCSAAGAAASPFEKGAGVVRRQSGLSQ
jgi:hypothetical protein